MLYAHGWLMRQPQNHQLQLVLMPAASALTLMTPTIRPAPLSSQ